MNNIKIKKIGTREEVFKGFAERTAGGLKKDDINEKQFGNNNIYISKKLSDRMKLNISNLRINNPNFFKRLQKKTAVNSFEQNNLSIENNNVKIHNNKSILKKNNSKTQKLSFKVNSNSVKTVYYPELQGVNIKNLKDELIREEELEDLGKNIQEIKSIEQFVIEDMPDININDLS